MVLRHVERPLLTGRVALGGFDALCGVMTESESISSSLILGGLLRLLFRLDGSVELFRALLLFFSGSLLSHIHLVQVLLLLGNLLLVFGLQGLGVLLRGDGLFLDASGLLSLEGGKLVSALGLIGFDLAGNMSIMLSRQPRHVNHVLLLTSQMRALSRLDRLLVERDCRGFRGSLLGGLLIDLECVNGGTK